MRKKFLIISTGRTGSTWLEMLLGSLKDVYVDYEFVWRPTVKTISYHYVIPNRNFRFSKALEEFPSDYSVVGSKLTLQIRKYSLEEYNDLKNTIEKDIRIIHLHRSYEEVILSERMLMLTRQLHIIKRTSPLINRNNLIDKIVKIYSRKSNYSESRIKKMYSILKERYKAGKFYFIKNLPQNLIAAIQGKIPFISEELWNKLPILLANDIWISSFSSYPYYLRVDYKDIPKMFSRIVKFIGSNADDEEIKNVLNNSITQKVVKKKPFEIVYNYSHFHKICRYFELLKKLVFSEEKETKNLKMG